MVQILEWLQQIFWVSEYLGNSNIQIIRALIQGVLIFLIFTEIFQEMLLMV